MSDLDILYNIYVNLSRSAYPGSARPFPQESLFEDEKDNLNKSIIFTFPHAKDAYGNDASEVYLQPDKLETVKEKMYQKIL